MKNEQVNDLGKKRRDYLWKKTQTLVKKYAAVLATAVCVGMFVFVLFIFAKYYSAFFIDPRSLPTSMTDDIKVFFGLGTCLFVLGLEARFANRISRSIAREMNAIPRVPPVREQIAALAADQILVRGSDPPPSAPAELLRGACKASNTPAGELLRPECVPAEVTLRQIEDPTA